MPQDGFVSVVIATYNMAKYLPIAVRSALAQTYSNIEIHVVDDGSTDNTRDVMREFENDPRVIYHWQENQGQARAKNKGILESRGEYVAFLDADDMWLPEKLEKQIPLLEASERTGVVYSMFSCMDADGNPIPTGPRPLHRQRITGPLLIDNFVGFNTTVVRRRCFEELGAFDESLPMGIDYALWLRFSTRYEFDYVAEPLVYYRVWPGQMSTNFKRRYECAERIMTDFLASNPGAVDRATIQEAWAHTYAGRGHCFRVVENDKLRALRDFARALSYKPLYLWAWKGIAKLILNRRT